MSRIPYGLKMIGLVLATFVLCTVFIFSTKSSAPTAYSPQPRSVAAAAPIAAIAPPQPTAQVAVAAATQPPPTVVSAPTPAPLPTTYQWIGSKQTSLPVRPRFAADVVVPGDYGDEQMTSVFRDAVNRTFRENRNAKAVVVFAYSSRDEVNRGADKGRALASSDRLGWTGDGTFSTFLPAPARDQGKIYLTLGSMLGDQRESSIER